MKRIILSLLIISFLSIQPAYSYWIWTPKSGKWVNPKNLPKDNPTEQFAYAKSFLDSNKYEEAKREFRKLLKAYPKSAEAAESQYYLGQIEEKQGKLYEAYLAYQMVIDKYPFSERIQEIIELEYKIAEKFMAGEKRKALGIELPVDNPAIEIFSKVVDNSTYGPFAPKAQYKLGLVLKGLLRYYEAEEAFNKVVSRYPDSEWASAAKFQIATCRASLSKGAAYDQGAVQEAKEKFETFVKEHPDAVLSLEAEKNIAQIREKEAEANYNTARFYEKQKIFGSAKIYYNDIIDNYTGSPWAVEAAVRLQIMERKNEK
ncbi:MAG: tetratricopeptide repeat protein [Candidatus Omnitrophica bacterium]|jgi:outer membrane protein assembly factor BamD|nr:tetratricopeptide repeat protein [Candidatus Omnitrophota bacterium]MDD5660550.1 tetratricopeptide repeat protein [Candidatus Omnitrophota bacterium]